MNNQEIEYLYCYHLPQYRTIGTRIVNNNIITELKLYEFEKDVSEHIITVYWTDTWVKFIDTWVTRLFFDCMFIIQFLRQGVSDRVNVSMYFQCFTLASISYFKATIYGILSSSYPVLHAYSDIGYNGPLSEFSDVVFAVIWSF